jgi:membrane associated rhomboid family serine protease
VADGRPWVAPELFGFKPFSRGFTHGSDGYPNQPGCARDELIDRCRRPKPRVRLVWTPESEYQLPAEELPFLHQALRERRHAETLRRIRLGLAIFCGTAIVAVLPAVRGWVMPTIVAFLMMLFLVGSAVDIIDAMRMRRVAGHTSEEDFLALARTHRHFHWLASRPVTFTWWIIVALVVVYVVGATQRKWAVPAAGLVKAEVRAGEVWRLLSGALLHVHFYHAFTNAGALLAIGRAIETHAHRVYVPIVFLISALVGSLFSVWLLPDVSSIGASGGVMGLVGFHAVNTYRLRAFVPETMFRGTLAAIGATALIGLLGFTFIDNAAHLGGLVGGVALGLLLLADSGSGPIEPRHALRTAGWLALGVTGLGAIATAAEIIAYARGWLILGRP